MTLSRHPDEGTGEIYKTLSVKNPEEMPIQDPRVPSLVPLTHSEISGKEIVMPLCRKKQLGLDIQCEIELVFFLGEGTTVGHACAF